MSESRRRFVSRTYEMTAICAMLSSERAISRSLLQLVSGEILQLPEGFTCRVLSRAAESMPDGYRTPGRPDGMACFAMDSRHLVLMRNHEVLPFDYVNGPYRSGQNPPSEAYKEYGMGGVSRVVLDAATKSVVSSNMVLMGTVYNCGGGLSPWGWLSCEETVLDDHGYVFLTDPRATRVQMPQKISSYGRFKHESASVDPDSMIAYLTEDQGDGCFYRFLPDNPSAPFVGRLQALKVKEEWEFKTAKALRVGDELTVEWVDIDDPDPSVDSVRYQARDKGAAVFSRGEGLWLRAGAAVFSCTDGGPAECGQIFCYEAENRDSGRLTLLAQSEGEHVLDMPDNITFHNNGNLFMAEDGNGDQFIRILKANGDVVDFAKNVKSNSEFAGVCFDPLGETLFVNIQGDGLTLAIDGPFAGLC